MRNNIRMQQAGTLWATQVLLRCSVMFVSAGRIGSPQQKLYVCFLEYAEVKTPWCHACHNLDFGFCISFPETQSRVR